MNYSQFEKSMLGKDRIDTDGVPKGEIYQCVDLVKRYMRDVHGLQYGSYGNAIDYWNQTAPAVLNKFTRVSGSAAQEGDIVVFKGNPGNSYGHIGVATGKKTDSTVEVLEQNGATGDGDGKGGDEIRKRSISRDRVAGLLRPRKSIVKRTKRIVWTKRRNYALVADTKIAHIPTNVTAGTTVHKRGEVLDMGEYTEWSNGKKFYRTKKQVKDGDNRGYGKSRVVRVETASIGKVVFN